MNRDYADTDVNADLHESREIESQDWDLLFVSLSC